MESPTRTLIATDESLVADLAQTLNDCRKELTNAIEEEERLQVEAERGRLLTEQQAQQYL